MAAPRVLASLLFLFCLASTVKTKRIHSFAGPYQAYAEKWFPCRDNQYETERRITIFFRTNHFNTRTPHILQRLTGNMTYPEDFGENFWGHVVMDTWSNNQWKENAFVFKFPKDGCTALRSNIPDAFRVFFGEQLLYKRVCKVPKGTYTFDNEPVNWTFPNFPVMPYGHWRFTLLMGPLPSQKPTACVIVECITMPKL